MLQIRQAEMLKTVGGVKGSYERTLVHKNKSSVGDLDWKDEKV